MNRHLVCLSLVALCGCLKAPEIVMFDRATALEQQAGGTFEDVEDDLAHRAIPPHPVALTPRELEAIGIMPTSLVDHTEETEADRIDALLRQHCIGEGYDGLLVDTHDACIGASDRLLAIALIDRSNRARLQLWAWMHAERPQQSLAELRKAWRDVHARGVVCRGWLQREDGTWEAKPC